MDKISYLLGRETTKRQVTLPLSCIPGMTLSWLKAAAFPYIHAITSGLAFSSLSCDYHLIEGQSGVRAVRNDMQGLHCLPFRD